MLFSRRSVCRALFTTGLSCSLLPFSPTGGAAQSLEESGSSVASLRDQLEKGLRARRKVEIQFVSEVADLVEEGELSRELVQGTFSWTLRKYRTRRYVVPFFEQALRERARREGNHALDTVPTTLTPVQ